MEIAVLIKEPGRVPELRNIENDLKTLQEIVGGYIETVTIAEDLVVICNEEGLIQNLPFNISFCGLSLVGTVIFAGVLCDEFCSLSEDSLNLLEYLM